MGGTAVAFWRDFVFAHQQCPVLECSNLMSRSRKKHAFTGFTTAVSEKQDKRLANRKERRVNKHILRFTSDETRLRPKRELSDVWCMDKDGKTRFDLQKHPQLMRK